MTVPLRVDVAQRRARLGRRHLLATASTVATPVDVARSVLALHSTDPATVYLSVFARSPATTAAELDAALYDKRTLARVLAMRRTVWVLPTAMVPVVQAACTLDIAARERRKLVQLLEDGGVAADGARWLTAVEPVALAALRERGEATAVELAAAVPELSPRIRVAVGKGYEGSVSVGSRLLFVLSGEGHVVRGRPRGGRSSTLYRWAPTEAWLPVVPALPTAQARTELARAWLASFGPATIDDLRWWTGWTLGQTRRAVAALDTVAVRFVDAGEAVDGVALAEDSEPVDPPAPWVALLPALDPTAMGWKSRAWYLPADAGRLFDRSGNVGPTVWVDGRIAGGWAQRPDGEVRTRLLDDIGAEATAAVAAAAARLAAWLGPDRVTPRFRTPLERELSG